MSRSSLSLDTCINFIHIVCHWLVYHLSLQYSHLIIRPHLTAMQMRPIVTDGVVWSVCLSIGHNLEPCKNGWNDRDAVWDVDSGEPSKPYYMGVHIPMQRGNFEGRNVSAWQMAGWQRSPSFGETPDQVHFSCRKLCWKVTKYDIHISPDYNCVSLRTF